MSAVRRIRGWSGDAQFTLACAVALIVGSLGPWLDFSAESQFPSSSVPGLELNAGALSILVAVAAIWLLMGSGGPRAAAESGALYGLALLAGALVAVTGIKHRGGQYDFEWGIFVSG